MNREQGDLFGPRPPAYPNAPGWSEPTTSKAAAVSIRPHVTPLQTKIVAFLIEQRETGATYTEIMAGCSLSAPTVCGRMVELINAKRVKIAAQQRRTPSNRLARVYVATEFA